MPDDDAVARAWLSKRTRAGLERVRAAGQPLGRPRQIPDDVRRLILDKHAAGIGPSAIAAQLNAQGVPTAHGGRKWWPSAINAVVRANEKPPAG